MLHEAAHALATRRGIKDTSAAGNRYHNKRFVALATELGLRGPDAPDKITGWSHCTLHGQAAYDAYADVVAGINAARLPFLIDLARPGRPGGGDGPGDGGEDQGDGPGKPAKRGGRRVPVECACQPEPRRLQLTPKQIEDGPIMWACAAPRSSSPKTTRTRSENPARVPWGPAPQSPGLACTRQRGTMNEAGGRHADRRGAGPWRSGRSRNCFIQKP